MIEKMEMIEKVGKKKFIEMAVHSQPKQTGAYLQKLRRWGKGQSVMVVCEHGNITVMRGKETKACKICNRKAFDRSPNIQVDSGEYFNIGTGTWGTNKEHRRYAKANGLVEAG